MYVYCCPNPECRKYSLELSLYDAEKAGAILIEKENLNRWQLIPDSKAKSFPDYISKQILDDYNEAFLTMEMSPKAFAILSRRCLQGIIRDFWKVEPGKLSNEINQIKD